jgi:hypothetical protein
MGEVVLCRWCVCRESSHLVGDHAAFVEVCPRQRGFVVSVLFVFAIPCDPNQNDQDGKRIADNGDCREESLLEGRSRLASGLNTPNNYLTASAQIN